MDRHVLFWVLPLSLGALSGILAGIYRPATLSSAARRGFVTGCLTSFTVATLLVLNWMIEERFHPLTFIFGTVFVLIASPAGGIGGSIVGVLAATIKRRLYKPPIQFQFSLETALYVMTVIAIGLAIVYQFR
jgi:hypothetical protein